MSATTETTIVRVPMTFRQRGGRKQIIAPEGRPWWAPPHARIDNTMVEALARAFRWRRLLETGSVATIREIAAKEIVEAILDGRQAPEMTLPVSMAAFPVEWERQRWRL